MKKIYIFLIALVASSTQVKAQYFSQDFEISPDLSTYVANPDGSSTNAAADNQFDNAIFLTDAVTTNSGSVTIVNNGTTNRLNLVIPQNGTGAGVGVTRSTPLGLKNSGKGVFQMAFDFEATSGGGTTSPALWFVIGSSGAALQPTSVAVPQDAESFLKMQFVCFNAPARSGEFFLRPMFTNGTGLPAKSFTGPKRITIVFNNTGLPATYTPPAGGTATVASGLTDIYVDNSLEYDDAANDGFGSGAAYIGGAKEINGFKFAAPAGSMNASVDNFVIQNAPGLPPLPVNLVSFAGKSERNGVALNWVTASEQNSDYFEVSKFDADTKSYVPFAKVNAAGNANEKITYQCVDAQPQLGVNYYQLKQVDKDGTSKIYDEISVDNSFVAPSFEVLQSDKNTYQYKIFSNEQGNAELSIVSLDGKVLSKNAVQINAGYNTGALATASLKTGLYLVRFKDVNNQVTVKKIIVTAN